jgi:hypothetical protein
VHYRTHFPEFCADILKIRTKAGELVPFVLNRPQRKFWELYMLPDIQAGRPGKYYILKARQMGFSTMIEALTYWRCSLWPFINGLVCAHSTDRAATVFLMLKIYYQRSPQNFRPTRKLSNRKEYFFAAPKEEDAAEAGLDSYISTATADNQDLGAGFTPHIVHLSEFARYERVNRNIKETMASLMPAIPKRPLCFLFMETTAQGEGYSKEVWDNQRNGIQKVFIPWTAEPTYTSDVMLDPADFCTHEDDLYGDEVLEMDHVHASVKEWWTELSEDEQYEEALRRMKWRRVMIDTEFEGDIDYWNQEYPITPEHAFLASGTPCFNHRRLRDYRAAAEESLPEHFDYDRKERKFYASASGKLRVYRRPHTKHTYAIGADPAGGHKDGDFSVAQVVDVQDTALVATYQGHIDPDDFSYLLADLGEFYNWALVAPEYNNHGILTVNRLTKDIVYPTLYRRKVYDKHSKQYSKQVGFRTDTLTKPMIINELRTIINEMALHLPDLPTIQELLIYHVDNKGGYTAPKGKHDDCVMALAIACHALTQAPEFEQKQVNHGPPRFSSEWAYNIATKYDQAQAYLAGSGTH